MFHDYDIGTFIIAKHTSGMISVGVITTMSRPGIRSINILWDDGYPGVCSHSFINDKLNYKNWEILQ